MYVGRYDFQGETLPVLDCFWLARLPRGHIIDPAESTELAWLPLFDPPPLAFSTMDGRIVDVVARLVARSLGQ